MNVRRKLNQWTQIGPDIFVNVTAVDGSEVRMAIVAPASVQISRVDKLPEPPAEPVKKLDQRTLREKLDQVFGRASDEEIESLWADNSAILAEADVQGLRQSLPARRRRAKPV